MAELAARQHGVVARRQLLEIGLGRRTIARWLEASRLHSLHLGVYALGHRRVSEEGRLMAAALACGPGAVLSHRSAASLWGIRPSATAAIDVTAPRRIGGRAGVSAHRHRLPPDERARKAGIPVTTVPRTLLDLSAVLPRSQVERALERAEMLRLADPLPLAALLARHAGRRGAGVLRSILDSGPIHPTLTRSELEERFLAFVADAGLPRPEVNVAVRISGGWVELDFVWRAERLVVELDGYASHGPSAAFERDRLRDRRLQLAGWRPVRVTWRQLHRDPRSLASDLATLLDGGRRRAGRR